MKCFRLIRKKRFGEMSLGNKKKVAIIAGLITEPELFILDEPTNGLDPLMQHYLFKEMTERNKEGMTIFLSSHNLREVQEYCTRAAFIRNGNIIAVEDIANQQMTGKVIALKGTNLPLEKLTNAGARIIEKEAGKARLIFDDDIKTILPLLQEKEITDVTITNQELEDKFMMLYEGEKSSEYPTH